MEYILLVDQWIEGLGQKPRGKGNIKEKEPRAVLTTLLRMLRFCWSLWGIADPRQTIVRKARLFQSWMQIGEEFNPSSRHWEPRPSRSCNICQAPGGGRRAELNIWRATGCALYHWFVTKSHTLTWKWLLRPLFTVNFTPSIWIGNNSAKERRNCCQQLIFSRWALFFYKIRSWLKLEERRIGGNWK